MSMPAAAAASAPVKATWLSASPAKTWLRSDDEVADQPAGERDEGARQEGVAHELVGEHQAGSPAGIANERRRAAALHSRTVTKRPKERLVTQKPTG